MAGEPDVRRRVRPLSVSGREVSESSSHYKLLQQTRDYGSKLMQVEPVWSLCIGMSLYITRPTSSGPRALLKCHYALSLAFGGPLKSTELC